jgi:hypothetical protein
MALTRGFRFIDLARAITPLLIIVWLSSTMVAPWDKGFDMTGSRT